MRDAVEAKLLSKISVKVERGLDGFRRFLGFSELDEVTEQWRVGEINNFQYLMKLNSFAGRSFNDYSQYPVFPWVIADYESEVLDLEDVLSFRDLSKPMGAIGRERSEKFKERFATCDSHVPASHYGVHYTSAMITCSFLVRLEPFTRHYLQLQGMRKRLSENKVGISITPIVFFSLYQRHGYRPLN